MADLALIYSYENSWDQGFRIREGAGVGRGYDNVAARYYTGMKSLKRNVDVIPATRDFAQYRVVVAPGLRIVSDEDADRLSQWVQGAASWYWIAKPGPGARMGGSARLWSRESLPRWPECEYQAR